MYPQFNAPGREGQWIYIGNGQWAPAYQVAASQGEYGNEGGYWAPAEGYVSQGSTSNYAGQFAGTREEIYQKLFGARPEDLAAFGDLDAHLGAAMEAYNPVQVGQGTWHNAAAPLMGALDSAGIDWRSNPELVDFYHQTAAGAYDTASGIDALNSRGPNWTQRLLSTASLWAGGYAMGNMLGGAQVAGGGAAGAASGLDNPALMADLGDFAGITQGAFDAELAAGFGDMYANLGDFSGTTQSAFDSELAAGLGDMNSDLGDYSGTSQAAYDEMNLASGDMFSDLKDYSGATQAEVNAMQPTSGGFDLDTLKKMYEVGSTMWDFLSPIFGGNLGFGSENAGGGGGGGGGGGEQYVNTFAEGYRSPVDNLDEAIFGAKKKFGTSGLVMPAAGLDTFNVGNPGLMIP